MNKTTEALKVAEIEDLQDSVTKALKKAFQLGQTYWQQADSESFSQNKKADETQAKFYELEDETVAAIREALAEPVQEPEFVGWYCAHCERGVDASEVTFHEQHEVCGRVISNDVPPKPVKQEPVAWMCWIDSDEEMNPANAQLTSYEPKAYAKRKPLCAAPQPVKQEPVAEIIGFERTNDIRGVKRIPRIKWNVPLWEDESPLQLGNLYAAPVSAKREWVELTDYELKAALEVHQVGLSVRIGRIAIAAFKEKNK